jgi:hypothetical protein
MGVLCLQVLLELLGFREASRPHPCTCSRPARRTPSFVLAGRVKRGSQKTSDALALGIHIDIGTSSLALDSTAHECTVRVGYGRSRISPPVRQR